MTVNNIPQELVDAIRDSIRDNSGGHSLTNLAGDWLWYAEHPVNMTRLAAAIRAMQQPKYFVNSFAEPEAINVGCGGVVFVDDKTDQPRTMTEAERGELMLKLMRCSRNMNADGHTPRDIGIALFEIVEPYIHPRTMTVAQLAEIVRVNRIRAWPPEDCETIARALAKLGAIRVVEEV